MGMSHGQHGQHGWPREWATDNTDNTDNDAMGRGTGHNNTDGDGSTRCNRVVEISGAR